MHEPTHADIMRRLEERMDEQDEKIDRLVALAERMNGAWFLMKVMGTVGLGILSFWSAFISYWTRQ